MAIISRWRAHARQVIQQVLQELPDDASLQEVRRVLREAYPFGERQMHPYRCWCAEQRAAIRKRFPDMINKKVLPAPLPPYALAIVFLPRIHKTTILELFAPCGWCMAMRGCIHCCTRRNRCTLINTDPMFQALAEAAKEGDAAARNALLDWLVDELDERVPGTW